MADQPQTQSDDQPYDETAWIAIAIELLTVIAAFVFALYEARR